MEVIFHYVDIKVIYDNMHDYFANMQHYKVNDTARKYTWKILKYYLLWLEKKPQQYKYWKGFFLQTDTNRRTDGDRH